MQYDAKYVSKTVKFKPSAPAQWGTDVHKAGEDFINAKIPLAERYNLLQPYLDILDKVEGVKQAEVEYGITKDLKPCSFFDKNAWLRGKLDVQILQNDKAMIWDWKTGTAKPNDFNELRCFSALTFLNNPEVEKTKNTYIWLKNDSPPTTEIIKRSQVDELLEPLVATIDQIEESMETGEFKPKPAGLCKNWCDVTMCKFHGRGRY